MSHSLEVDSVLLEFGNKRVLQDVYFKNETGTITGLLGRIGTGKSCLMRIIYGELEVLNKSIRLDGETLLYGVLKLNAFRYLPQFNFIPKNRRTKSVFTDFGNDFSEFVTYFPEFEKYYSIPVGRLSGGEIRILEIYNIIKTKSKFCMLDEPFSHVMPVHVDIIKEVIIEEKKHKGIIMTDHLYEHILERFQIANVFGGQYGTYIKNEDKKTGNVKAVSFYIAKVGFPDAPFRIRIYAKGQLNECPGKDLLNESMIVSNTQGEGWFTVDISEYGFNFPEDGIYVMMEWVYSGDQYYYDYEHEIKSKDGKSNIKTYHVYGLSLGNVWKQRDEGYWCKGLGETWSRMNDYYKGYVDVMINADIEFQIE